MTAGGVWLYVSIALGGALGSVLRFTVGGWVAAVPWGTMVVNVLGSFVIGLLFYGLEPLGRCGCPHALRQGLLVGLCGGFTTFSSFSVEALSLMHQEAWGRMAVYVLGSVGLCLVAVWLGYVAALHWLRV